MAKSLTRDYFDKVYAAHDDPWDFAASEYEKAKYAETLATLDRERYANGLEIGCSIGVQTALLAERCHRLLAIDTSSQALERAQRLCAHLTNVTFRQLQVPGEYPPGPFDLTVASEVGYYLALPDLSRLADRIVKQSAHEAELLLVHWLPVVPDYPLTGDQVHDFFLERPEWLSLRSARHEKYRIDLLRKVSDGASPARQ